MHVCYQFFMVRNKLIPVSRVELIMVLLIHMYVRYECFWVPKKIVKGQIVFGS